MTAVAVHHASFLREHIIPAIEDHLPPPHGDAADHTPHLTAAIAAGDPVAFAAFYEAWFDRCYNVAAALTRRDESFCLDVVQDAMLRAVRSMRPMARDDLERWLVRVVHTTALDALRAERRRARRSALRADKASPGARISDNPAHLAELAEQIDWLTRAMADLDADDRALLEHRFTRDRTLEETGRAVGLTGGAAHGRIRRILARLRRSTGLPPGGPP
jgi:RNA polymerase sigma-70 factor (ECF subfamily)